MNWGENQQHLMLLVKKQSCGKLWGSNPEKNWIANSFVRKTGLGWTQNVEPRKSMHILEMDRNTIFFVLKIALISFLPECWLWSCCKNNILISFQLEHQFEIFNQRRIQLISPISNQDDFAVKKMILCKPESWVDLVRQIYRRSLRCSDSVWNPDVFVLTCCNIGSIPWVGGRLIFF